MKKFKFQKGDKVIIDDESYEYHGKIGVITQEGVHITRLLSTGHFVTLNDGKVIQIGEHLLKSVNIINFNVPKLGAFQGETWMDIHKQVNNKIQEKIMELTELQKAQKYIESEKINIH